MVGIGIAVTRTGLRKKQKYSTSEGKDMDNSREVVEEGIYILLKDTPGSFSKSKKFLSLPFGSDQEEKPYVTRGELLKKYTQEDESELLLVSIETPKLSVAASNENVRPLKQEEFEILHAVPSKMERFDLLEGPLFPEILMIKVNDDVTVHLDNKNLQECKGKVRYIGPVQHKKGKHFGILFQRPVGDMDGTVDNITLFAASKKHGAIVSADQIINISKKNSTSELQKERTTHIHNLNEYALLKKGSRVIYFDDKKIRRGTICFLGYVAKRDNAIYAGVELDKEMKGKKLGNYVEGRKVFDCGRNRGLVVEAVELIREEDFDNKQHEKLTNDVQNEPGKWQCQLQQFQEQQWSETDAAEVSDSDERGGVENPRELNQAEREAQVVQEQRDLIKKAGERNKRGSSSLPHQDNSQPVENAIGERYRDEERLRQIQSEKKVVDRFIDSVSIGLNISENKSNPHYEEINQFSSSDPKNKLIESWRRNEENIKSSAQKLNNPPVTSDTFQSESIPDKIRNNRNNVPESFQMRTMNNSKPEVEQIQGGAVVGFTKERPLPSSDEYIHADKKNGSKQDDNKTKDGDKDKIMDLAKGTMVEIHINPNGGVKKTCYGVVKWIGHHEGIAYRLVGLELEEYDGTSDGTFQQKRYFTCPPNKAFFVKAKKCKPDRRFEDGGEVEFMNNDISPSAPALAPPPYEDIAGFCQLEKVPKNYLPPECIKEDFLGKKMGIQGHHNSCYMDATLFAMFSYSHVFDVALHRRKRKTDIDDYEQVQKILKEGIVNPLRVNGKVHRSNVLELRQYLNKHTNIGGFLNEEKDPEEFVVLLFEKVLQVDPFIKLQTDGTVNTSHLYQLFPPAEQRNTMPSIQFLLELSLLNADLKLKETPSVMVLQMPRFGQTKMFKRVFINPTLDLSPVLQDILHRCEICNESALIQCPQCACDTFGPTKVTVYLCSNCELQVHKNSSRKDHEVISLEEGQECTDPERNILELFAVVSITTSHYVSFVKCGEKQDSEWVFFDSMADRYGGEDGYNIPEVTKLDKLKDYLYGEPMEVANLDNKKSDEKVLRFYEDASLCFYRNQRFTMYK